MCPKWNRVLPTSSFQPKARHGHRAVAIKDLIVIFGGGNEGILSDLIVFNTIGSQWFKPIVQGNIPRGRASYGFIVDKSRIIMFGGMLEYSECSNELFELQVNRWEWNQLHPRPPLDDKPLPIPRFGHSFTLIGDKAYLFGGLTFDREDSTCSCVRYLNDLYTLEWHRDTFSWNMPNTYGKIPSPRESHSAVAHIDSEGIQRLIIYGGMSGVRLGDLWVFVVNAMTWIQVETSGPIPMSRSLHTATIVKDQMFVFGGWVPVLTSDSRGVCQEKEWKVTNQLLCFNISNMSWKDYSKSLPGDLPKARAGHSAVEVNERIYIWSGRDGYRRAWNNQVCCNDIWLLDIVKPPLAPLRPQLFKAETKSLKIDWSSVPGTDNFILQLSKYDVPFSSDNTEKNSLKLCLPKSIDVTPTIASSNYPDNNEVKCLADIPQLSPISVSKELNLNFLEPSTLSNTAVPVQKFHILATSQPVIHKSPLQESQPTPSKSAFTLVSKITNFENQIPLLRPVSMPLFRLSNVKGIAEIGQKSFTVTRTTNLVKLATPLSKAMKPKTFIVKNPGFKLVAVNKDSQIKLVPSHSTHVINKHNINTPESIFKKVDFKLSPTFMDNSEGSSEQGNKKKKCLSADCEVSSSQSSQIILESQANETVIKEEEAELLDVPSFPEQVHIKKCNTTGGIFLTWIPPPGDVVTAYKVTLFVKESVSPTGQKIVYNGVRPECFIYKAHLDSAYIDDSGGTRAVKFSISARNCKGSGPPLIVKWVLHSSHLTN